MWLWFILDCDFSTMWSAMVSGEGGKWSGTTPTCHKTWVQLPKSKRRLESSLRGEALLSLLPLCSAISGGTFQLFKVRRDHYIQLCLIEDWLVLASPASHQHPPPCSLHLLPSPCNQGRTCVSFSVSSKGEWMTFR